MSFIVILSANIISFLTVIVIIFIVVTPLLSVTLYLTLYVPTFDVSTLFSITSILDVISTPFASFALTPALGSNLSPTFITLSSAVIIGALFIAVNFGFTVIVIIFIVVIPLLSVTLYLTLYVPAFDVSTLFSIISILDVISTPFASFALTPALGSNLSPTFIILSSAVIIGALSIAVNFGFTVTLL